VNQNVGEKGWIFKSLGLVTEAATEQADQTQNGAAHGMIID
jgi:hypothetical protein